MAICTSAPGEGHSPRLEKVGEGEVQAHTEHEENDPHISYLCREPGIGHEAGCEAAKYGSGEKITDEWRYAQPCGHKPEPQRKHESSSDCCNQRRIVHSTARMM
jgi:hypothetical protein